MWWNIIIAALKRLLGIVSRKKAQAAADTAAIRQNEDAEHAVEHVENEPVPDRNDVDRRLRDGTF